MSRHPRCLMRSPASAGLVLAMIGHLASVSPLAAAPPGAFKAGGWTGAAHPSDRGKPFEYCSATATNSKEIALTLALDRNYRWRLSFSNPLWNFNDGSGIQIVLRADKAQIFRGAAAAASPTTLEFRPEEPFNLFASLWSAGSLDVVAGGFGFDFELLGISDALNAVTQCVWQRLGRAARAPARSAARTSEAARQEARAVAAMVIGYARFSDAGEPSVSAIQGEARAEWKTGLVTSSVEIVEGDQPALDAFTTAVIERDMRNCRGAVHLVKAAETINSTALGRMFTSCLAPDAPVFVYQVAVPRPLGGYYLFASRAAAAIVSGAMQRRVGEVDARLREVVMTAIQQAEARRARAQAGQPADQ